jgi:hypothetical protein
MNAVEQQLREAPYRGEGHNPRFDAFTASGIKH